MPRLSTGWKRSATNNIGFDVGVREYHRIRAIALLEPVAVAQADAVHSFVVFFGVGVRHVLEIDRQVIVRVDMVADFYGNVEQHARAEPFFVEVRWAERAIVNGGAEAETEEEP